MQPTTTSLTITNPRFKMGLSGRVLLCDTMIVATDDARIVEIPAGFQTDFCSIPRIARAFFHSFGRHQLAGAVHDFIYKHMGIMPDGDIYSRKEADQLFLLALQACGVGPIRRSFMYHAVRFGGGKYWSKDNG